MSNSSEDEMEPRELADMRDAMIEAGLSEEDAQRLANKFYRMWDDVVRESTEHYVKRIQTLMADNH
jgi:hypothetical protein